MQVNKEEIEFMDFNKIKDILSTQTLLYVEDEEDLREQCTELFELLFCEVAVACDGVEALRYYNNNKLDVVITDIRMPHMDGCELLEAIKKINPNQKIIAMSGEHSKNIAQSSNFDAWLRKPANLNELLEVLV